MVFELEPPLDRADNPYMPRHLQDVRLNLDPDDFAVPYTLPKFPPHNTGMIDSGHMPSLSVATPMHDDMDEHLDDFDDNSSDSLDSLEDHEFPSYFTQRGSPPRLFHSHGTYSLPVDGDEMKRQEAQHILFRMTFGSNCGAPIRELLSDNPKERKVVDLCAGAGHWVLEMAKEFPLVEFRGLDLVPIQTRYPPQNVRFEIADVTGVLRFPDASVDVVHARMTCLRAEAVPHFLLEVARILRPGGLFLFADWAVRPTLHPGHPFSEDHEAYIPRTVSFYNTMSRIVPTLAPEIPHLIQQIGSFEEPVSKQWAIPISTPYSPDSTCSSSHYFISRVMVRVTQGLADALVAGGLFPPEDADAFKDELEDRDGICSIYQTVWARKLSIV